MSPAEFFIATAHRLHLRVCGCRFSKRSDDATFLCVTFSSMLSDVILKDEYAVFSKEESATYDSALEILYSVVEKWCLTHGYPWQQVRKDGIVSIVKPTHLYLVRLSLVNAIVDHAYQLQEQIKNGTVDGSNPAADNQRVDNFSNSPARK